MLKEIQARTCSWPGISKTVNLSILPNFIYRLNKITIKSLQVFFFFFKQTDKLILKHTEMQRTQESQTNFEEKKKKWRIYPDLKTYYKISVIMTVWYWHKRTTEQRNRIYNPENYPCIHIHTIHSVDF